MEGIVLSFLYSLIMSMGLTGASYAEIEQAFPDNTPMQNQVLYSVANDPLQNGGGFQFVIDGEVNPNQYDLYMSGTSEYFQTSWAALMEELGFAVVGNNVDVAIDNGFTTTGAEWVGTMSYGDDVAIVSFLGTSYEIFRNSYIPDNVNYLPGYEGIQRGYAPVFRWVYNDQVVYSSTPFDSLGAYIWLPSNTQSVHFIIINDTLHFQYYYNGRWQDVPLNIYNWINQGIVVENAEMYVPTENEVFGQEYLSFGTADNPVVSVAYDPATGTTTYTYKDGTISTTPPVAIGDTIALSPSITQPLTNYIINEGDITNIYNPDAAIPSEAVPFDFASLGQLLNQTFIPQMPFDFKPSFNRLIAKYDWETPVKKIAQKFNITGRRPSFPVSFVWFNEQIEFDFWDWCDTLLISRNYAFYMKFVRFFLYFLMVTGCISLILRTFHVKIYPTIVK